MSAYLKSFENEIAVEALTISIGKKVKAIADFVIKLFKQAIKFIGNLLNKLRRHKREAKTDKTPTPTTQNSGTSDVLKNTSSTIINSDPTAATLSKKDEEYEEEVQDLYDCGNELIKVIDNIDFCTQLLMKRPRPDHKVGKNYDKRWEQDNSLIMDRMEDALNTITKLNDIGGKTVSEETGEKLHARLVQANDNYTKYAKMYSNFCNMHLNVAPFMQSTIASFDKISDIGAKTLKLVLELYTPAE